MATPSSSNEDQPWDVIIIGAGLAGLTAAYRILKTDSNAKVLVLEAKDHVGGRTVTYELNAANGKDVWDLGGQWIGSTQYHILWLMEELGITHYPQDTEGTKILRLGDDKVRTYSSSIPRLPFLSLIDMQKFIMTVDKMTKSIPLDDPRKAKNADKWDGMTVDSFMRDTLWTQKSMEVFEIALLLGYGCRPKSISLLYFLWDMVGCGGISKVFETDPGSAQESKIKGGAMQISEKLRDIVGKDNVLIGEPVTKIDQSDRDIIRVTTATGKDFKCRYIINAAPLHCSVDVEYLPKPPTTRIDLARYSPVGHLFKFIITYKTAFWKEKGFSGDIVTTGGKPGCSTGPVQAVMDASTPDGNPALVGFYANGREWGDKTEEECKEAVLNALAEYFGPEAKESLDFMQKDWGKESYNGGCSSNVMTPGAISYFLDGLKRPFDRVHWAGTESARVWKGYMDGAVQSGLRAADEVLDRLRPDLQKDDILKQLHEKRQTKSKM